MNTIYRSARGKLARSQDADLEGIRCSIQQNEIAAGTHLSPEHLTREFGIAPERANDGLASLIQTGFVDPGPTTSVRSLSLHRDQQTPTIAAIEVLACIRSSVTTGHEFRTDLNAIAQLARKYAEQGKSIELALTGYAFGLRLVAATASSTMLETYAERVSPALAYGWSSNLSGAHLGIAAELMNEAARQIAESQGEKAARTITRLRYRSFALPVAENARAEISRNSVAASSA